MTEFESKAMNQFFLPMRPPTTTHQMKAVRIVRNKPVFYEPPAVQEARAKLQAALSPHRPPKPARGAVRLTTRWCFEATANHVDGEYRTSKPDTDNLQKLLKDCMTDCGYWLDDAQVASELVEKFWTTQTPGIFIRIEPLDQPKNECR